MPKKTKKESAVHSEAEAEGRTPAEENLNAGQNAPESPGAEKQRHEKGGNAESAEKKKFNPKKFFSNPFVFSVIALAIIAAGAFAILLFTAPQVLSVDDFTHASTENLHKPKIIILTSKDCQGCQRDNSFINQTLLANGIIPLGEELDIDSADGQKIIQEFGINAVPFVILDGKSLDSTIQVKQEGVLVPLQTVLENNVRAELIFKSGDYYLIPEHERTVMLLDRNSCGSKEKIQVDLYTDPYCAPCALASLSFNQAVADFGKTLDVNYNFLPIDSKKMLYTWEKISPFANYSICANRQGVLAEFQASAYAYYCNPDQNVYDLNSLQNCPNSSAFHVPIPTQRLLQALDFAKINRAGLGSCLEQIEKDKPLMITTAQLYGIDKVPEIVLNCKYLAHAEYLQQSVCAINPQLSQCKK